jgi:hypothetical protein
MISVFEMLPISRRRVGLSTTGKRSDRVSELETVVIAGDIMDENFLLYRLCTARARHERERELLC